MQANTLITVGIEVYVAFFASLAVVMAGLMWNRSRQDKRARVQYFDGFDVAELRMSRYQIGLVLRVLETEGAEAVVVPIWTKGAPVTQGKTYTLSQDELIPFDASRFF